VSRRSSTECMADVRRIRAIWRGIAGDCRRQSLSDGAMAHAAPPRCGIASPPDRDGGACGLRRSRADGRLHRTGRAAGVHPRVSSAGRHAGGFQPLSRNAAGRRRQRGMDRRRQAADAGSLPRRTAWPGARHGDTGPVQNSVPARTAFRRRSGAMCRNDYPCGRDRRYSDSRNERPWHAGIALSRRGGCE
jgi:hypothetical protein